MQSFSGRGTYAVLKTTILVSRNPRFVEEIILERDGMLPSHSLVCWIIGVLICYYTAKQTCFWKCQDLFRL